MSARAAVAAVAWLLMALHPAAAAAQEADAVAPRGRDGRPPDTVPLRGGSPPMAGDTGATAVGGERGGEALDELTARVASRLRCPVCRNQSVLESSATLAREMQSEIRRRLADGETPEEVEEYFVSRYGEWILLKPRPRGLNLLVYLLPAVALVAGGLLVWGWLRRRAEGAAETGAGVDGGLSGGGPRTSPFRGQGVGEPGTVDGEAPAGDRLHDAPERGLSPEEEGRLREILQEEKGWKDG